MLKLINKFTLFASLFSLFGLLFIPLHVFAAPNQDLTWSPAVAQIKLDPGQSHSGSFLIINHGKSTYNFSVYARPYNVSGESYTPNFTPIPGAINVSKWFKFSLGGGSITPGQIEKVNYTVTVPANVEDGGYYAVAFGQTNNPKALIGVTINERVGTIFFIQVGNNFVKKGNVTFWASKFFQEPPLTSNIKVANTGSIYFKTDISYKISDIFGHTKYSLTGQKFIFPQTIRNIDLPWAKSPSFGLFKVSANVGILGNTQYLSSKYVLVMSRTVRIWTTVITVLVIVAFIAFRIGHSRGKKKSSSHHHNN
jgi:hypothetical protein